MGADAGTAVTINGTPASGAVQIALQKGENVIRIETASIDGSETAVYTLSVTRGDAPAGSVQTPPEEGQQETPAPDTAAGDEEQAADAGKIDIPDTGSLSVAMLAVLTLGAAASIAVSRKKRR